MPVRADSPWPFGALQNVSYASTHRSTSIAGYDPDNPSEFSFDLSIREAPSSTSMNGEIPPRQSANGILYC